MPRPTFFGPVAPSTIYTQAQDRLRAALECLYTIQDEGGDICEELDAAQIVREARAHVALHRDRTPYSWAHGCAVYTDDTGSILGTGDHVRTFVPTLPGAFGGYYIPYSFDIVAANV